MNKPKRWSYSSLSTYKQCPLKWKLSYIDGIPWKPSAAMTRGSRMHLMAEEFVKGVVDRVHPEIQNMGPTLLGLKTMGAKAEEVWLLDSNWNPVTNQDDAWIKAIIDVHYVDPEGILHVKDYKSGRMYDDHREQLELYGLIGLCVVPTAKRVETSAIYMDTNHEGMQGSIIRAMLPKMIERWHNDAVIMMADETFDPKPGNCRFCDFAKDKGGQCEFSSASRA